MYCISCIAAERCPPVACFDLLLSIISIEQGCKHPSREWRAGANVLQLHVAVWPEARVRRVTRHQILHYSMNILGTLPSCCMFRPPAEHNQQ
jgi:hypothetical protein